MRKNAFTIAELTVCIIIMMILAIFAVTNIKPNDNKIRLFVYGAMDNIAAVVGTIVSENSSLDKGNISANSKTYDWLCVHVGDYFSLKSEANCQTTSKDSATVNFTFANNVTVQGFAVPWQDDTKYSIDGNKYKFKEFVIDIDGNTKGMNKVGIDRFPMRVYRGGLLEGAIVPVNCALSNAGSYCNKKSGETGVDLTKANEIISYDIYRPESSGASKANVVASHQSYKQADCGIFGGSGYFTVDECSADGYKVFLRCLNNELCASCYNASSEKNICPMNGTSQITSSNCKTYVSTNNPNQVACFMMLHKPSTGAGIIIDTVADTMLE